MKALKAYVTVIPELLFLLLLLFLSHNALTNDFGVLHNVNLIFHEAGHTIFFMFGEFVSVLGGSLMQILVPAIITLAFLREGRVYGVVFGVWWIGENFTDISVYAADAQARVLPLLGGDGVIHDWWYLLTKLGLVEHAAAVGLLFWCVGALVMGLSVALLLRIIHQKLPENVPVN